MTELTHTWAIVLAAGDGTRLRSVTVDAAGQAVPKQYCGLRGDRSLLEATLERCRRLVPPERTVVVVAPEHRRWWSRALAGVPPENVVVQPQNRGTAAGLLLPLLAVLDRDWDARVLVFPSDHHVEREEVVRDCFLRALAAIEKRPERVVLLGISPDRPETEYGWILPSGERDGETTPLAEFVEKPELPRALELLENGGLWNSFMLAGLGRSLAAGYEDTLFDLLLSMLGAFECSDPIFREAALRDLYRRIDAHDYCRDVLEHSVDRLSLIAVPHCGWTDLGTPERVARCLAALPASTRRGRGGAALDLAIALSANR